LLSNTGGVSNTATGAQTLESNTTASYNTAIGAGALQSNTRGDFNTAIGDETLVNNTTGTHNTAVGWQALLFGTGVNSAYNTAIGARALGLNTHGQSNTAVGAEALVNNRTGNNNTALGFEAGYDLTTGGNNLDIGNVGVAGDSNKIRIGTPGTQTKTFVAGIHGVAVAGQPVVVSTIGQLGVASSSERFKEAIKPMDKASEAILALKPVNFHYKKELDPDGVPQFGLIAEEVAKVNPALVLPDKDGKPFTVRYEAVNAMLLNEFLKEHRKVQELEANDAEQQREIEALAAIVKEQASQIQKVSAHLEAGKPAPQVVDNP
jgi:hypothetical protein